LRIYLAWQEHRKLSREQYELEKDALGLFGEIVCLDPDGSEIDWGKDRSDEPIEVTDAKLRQRSLTAMRVRMAQTESGRILIGGRRAGFQGAMPGVLEEASLSLANGQPLYVAGGFGGASADIANALGIGGSGWLPVDPIAPPPDNRLTAGLQELTRLATKTGWKASSNGLSEDENSQLAATYRPSEIAALVSLGLGHRFAQSAVAEPIPPQSTQRVTSSGASPKKPVRAGKSKKLRATGLGTAGKKKSSPKKPTTGRKKKTAPVGREKATKKSKREARAASKKARRRSAYSR
jgi:hypothetical protein